MAVIIQEEDYIPDSPVDKDNPMSLSDATFSVVADATLNRLVNTAESLDEEGLLDVELAGSVLTIIFPSGPQFVINKHTPSQQIWLASPLSGGLHFSYDETAQAWVLPDGRWLDTLLRAELETVLGSETDA